MAEKVEVEVAEVERVFHLLEKFVSFFHQPLHYRDVAQVDEFLQNGAYEELATLYYETVWGWLPPETQRSLEDRK